MQCVICKQNINIQDLETLEFDGRNLNYHRECLASKLCNSLAEAIERDNKRLSKLI